jgi:hypothetical protein
VELLECPICIECYDVPPSEIAPVMLPCGHSVCRQCAEDLQAAALCCHRGGGLPCIACPSCCRQLDLPPGGVKSLPVNYALVHAAQAIKDAAREMSEHERAAAPAAALAAVTEAPALVPGRNAAATVAVQASPTGAVVVRPILPGGGAGADAGLGAGLGAGAGAGADAEAGAGTGADGGGGGGARHGGADGVGGDDGAPGGGIGLADLLQQLQFTSAQIADYVPALTEAGYDLVEDLATATADQLSEEAGMKKPHARRITTHFSH